MTVRIILSFGVAWLIAAGGCSDSNISEAKRQQMPQKTIEQVQEAHTPEWMAIPGVEGTAIGLFKGKPCIKVFTSLKAQQLRRKIPSSIEGYAVVIEETGTFRPLEPQ